jgi:hypothetical protein
MINFNSRIANKAIEGVLELSADTHIERHNVAKDTPEYDKLTGAIAAYGKAISLLVELQQRDEFYAMICGFDLPESGSELVH